MSTFTSWRAIMRALVAGAQVAAQVAARPVPRWPRAWCLVLGPWCVIREPWCMTREPWPWCPGGRRPGAPAHGPRALQRK